MLLRNPITDASIQEKSGNLGDANYTQVICII